MSITLYISVAIVTAGLLHWASAKSSFQSRSKRTLLGASGGGLSYGIFSEWTLTISVIDSAIQGKLGIFGYIFALGFFSLLGVWVFNLYTTRKYLVM